MKDELKYLKSMEDKLALIKQELQDRRTVIKSNKGYLRNLGIYRLPVEIIRMILLFAHEEADEEGVNDALTWSHISCGFRIVVRDTPGLWNTVSNTMHTKHLALSISRSGYLPLRVLINQGERSIHWLLPGRPRVSEFLQMVMPFKNRWKSLFLRIRETDVFDVLETTHESAFLSLFREFESSSLEELDIVYDEGSALQRSMTEEIDDLPTCLSSLCDEWNLPALKICRAVECIPLPKNLEALETLDLSLANNWAKGWSFVTLCKLLERCVNLRNLILDFDLIISEDDFDEVETPVTVGKVETLHVTVTHEVCDGDILKFMSLLRLPQLKDLTVVLDTDRCDLIDEVFDMCVPLYAVTEADITLRTFHLKIDGLEIDEDFMSTLFGAVPRVDELVIEAPRTKFSLGSGSEVAVKTCNEVQLRKCIFKRCTHLNVRDAKHVEAYIRKCATRVVDFVYSCTCKFCDRE